MNRIILCLIISFCAQRLNAQYKLSVQHLNVEDGLSQSSVYNIFQDSKGFMWFATGDGLNRYDGKEFIVYKSHISDTSATQFKDRNINSNIFEDDRKRLWMSTENGTSYFDCIHSKFINALNIFSIAFGMDTNSLWCYAAQRGLYQVNTYDLRTRFYPFDDVWQKDKEHYCYIHNAVDAGDHVWLADKAGLLYFNKKSFVYKRAIHSDRFNNVSVLSNGNLLLGSENGVYLYDTSGNKLSFIALKDGLNKSIKWTTAAEDTAGAFVYLGSQNGAALCKLSIATQKYEFINFQKGIVYCLLIDRSRNLWVGTEGNGVYKLDIKSPKFFCYPSQMARDNETGLMVKSIYRNGTDPIWIGTYNNGLITYDPVKKAEQRIKLTVATDGVMIGCIIKDSSGKILVSAGTELIWLNPKTGSILDKFDLRNGRLKNTDIHEIFSLVEWKKDHYLIAGNGGLYALNHEDGVVKNLFFFDADTAVYSWIYNLYKGNGDAIYIGKRNRNGYSKIRMINDTSLEVLDKGFDHLVIRNFYRCMNNNILWMASEKGLIAYNETTKKYKVFDESSGLSNSCVYSILPANDSSLWVSTNRGLANVKVHYGKGVDISADIFNYNSKDGLQSDEFNTGAYFKGSDGTLYFGGIEGVNWFNPQNISANIFAPEAVITKVFVNDKLYANDTAAYMRSLDLPYTSNTISLSLASLEFTRQEKNQFAYKLEGLEENWIYTTNDKVRYSNLPPGEYTFLLKASNNDGKWNEAPVKLLILIKPPFWRTWWFEILLVLLMVVVVVIVVKYYTQQKIRSKTKELEQKQALYIERLRISKDVHDDLGSGLSKISLMAGMAQKKAIDNAPLSKDIRQISAISTELVDNMRDLIWVLNPENTTLDHLVTRIREYCGDYFELMPVKTVLQFPDNVPALPITREGQRNIFLTIKEALHNSMKHAEASEIKVVLHTSERSMHVEIADNGKGFEMAHLKGSGNGLRNMRQRIEMIGGSFSIVSAPGKTTIYIVVPFESRFIAKTTTLV